MRALRPGYVSPSKRGICSECGKKVWVSGSSAPPERRRCRDCQHARPKAAQPREPRKCLLGECAATYTPTYEGQRFCSRQCASRSRRPICEICGDRYKGTYRGQRTCGRVCGVELRQREGSLGRRPPASCPIWVRECAYCDVTFIARRQKQVTCSADCGRRLNWARTNAARRRVTEHICPCGVVISPRRHKCDGCLTESARLQKQRKRRAERARQRGIVREPYTLEEIARRDRYRCGLCHKRVAMTKVVPHSKAPTIDHVMPIACGGDDTRANVQLAHFSCNARKHTGGSQQLAMIG